MAGIPKIIFQTDKTSEIRDEWKEGPPSLQNVGLPGWKYEFYDDEAVDKFVRENFPHYYAIWKSYPYPIMRVDTFRYMKLYKEGGFYSDMDYKYIEKYRAHFLQQGWYPYCGISSHHKKSKYRYLIL